MGISLLCSVVSADDKENWEANRLASIDPQHEARLTVLPLDKEILLIPGIRRD